MSANRAASGDGPLPPGPSADDRAPGVLVLADDLMWASRLVEAVRRAGAQAIRIGSRAELDVALHAHDEEEPGRQALPGSTGGPRVVGSVVDLNGRRYQGIEAIESMRRARLPVIAVSQHDDLVTRRRALGAGAGRVFSYNKFFTDGPRLVAAWLRGHDPAGGA